MVEKRFESTTSWTFRRKMAIPDYESCMLPLLHFAGDGREYQLKDAVHKLAAEFNLSAEEIRRGRNCTKLN
jgi:restriction endonuclease Mrr